MPHFPMKVEIKGVHNHTVNTAAALCYRDVSQSVVEKFQDLYCAGYSPAAAYQLHQYDLLEQHGAEYYRISGDRHFCPDKAWCYRFVYKSDGS